MKADFLSPPWLRGNVGNRWNTHTHGWLHHTPAWSTHLLSAASVPFNHHFNIFLSVASYAMAKTEAKPGVVLRISTILERNAKLKISWKLILKDPPRLLKLGDMQGEPGGGTRDPSGRVHVTVLRESWEIEHANVEGDGAEEAFHQHGEVLSLGPAINYQSE